MTLTEEQAALIEELRGLVGDNGNQPCPPLGAPLGQVVTHTRVLLDDPAAFHFYAAAVFATLGLDTAAIEQCNLSLGCNPNHALSHPVMSLHGECTDRLRAREWPQSEQDARPVMVIATTYPDREPSIWKAETGPRVYDTMQLYNYMTQLDVYRRYPTYIEPTFIYVYVALLSLGPVAEFAELGGTLFDAYEKIRNSENLLAGGLELDQVSMINIEFSSFLADASRHVHYGTPIRVYREWHEVPEARAPRVSFARNVASYAFANSDEFATWIAHSRVTVLREDFALSATDVERERLGKRVTYFSLSAFLSAVAAKGYSVRLITEYPRGVNADGVHSATLYLIVENLTPEERARFCARFDGLDFSSCRNSMNMIQHAPMPLHSGLMAFDFSPPYLQESAPAPSSNAKGHSFPVHIGRAQGGGWRLALRWAGVSVLWRLKWWRAGYRDLTVRLDS